MEDATIQFYSNNVDTLFKQYESVEFSDIYGEWLEHIPNEGFVLDVGCGTGRDAAFLAEKGLYVTAVEPAAKMLEAAQSEHNHTNITWLNDSLPELQSVFKLQIKYDFILLSAVWMHIAPTQRERALRKLSSLLKPNGKIVVTLRHGECHDSRVMYEVSADEISQQASKFGLTFKLLTEGNKSDDKLGRQDVSWESVLLQLPDDGTGAFPLIRNIVVNDNKSSTYKVALLRALLRVAEGHPGAVIDQTNDHVVIPLGLVALYWLKLFKPLVDHHNLLQNSDPNKGLGFIKPKGWQQLTSYSNDDFYIGAHYNDPALAQAITQTFKDICKTIKEMPVNFIKLPGTKQQIFEVESHSNRKKKSALSLNSHFFAELGNFIVPRNIWNALSGYSVWIEPALVNEWCTLMAGYNKGRGKEHHDFLNALKWENPTRKTDHVRERVNQLMQTQDVYCVWTETSIKRAKTYDIDHAFPFARWPNNDLWNLLPATSKANSAKSDKLPSLAKLQDAKPIITEWWQQGWQHNQEEFFEQANLALPNLPLTNRNFEDVFEAMKLQRNRIKDFQQLEEWK